MIDAYRIEDVDDIIDCLAELMQTEHLLEPSRLHGRKAAEKYFSAVEKKVKEQSGKIFVWRNEEGIAAVLIVYPEQNEIFEQPGKHLSIGDIVVKPAYRHTGIGTALVKKAESFAMENGLKEIRLYTLFNNTTALQLYRNSGYRAFGIALTKQIARES